MDLTVLRRNHHRGYCADSHMPQQRRFRSHTLPTSIFCESHCGFGNQSIGRGAVGGVDVELGRYEAHIRIPAMPVVEHHDINNMYPVKCRFGLLLKSRGTLCQEAPISQ